MTSPSRIQLNVHLPELSPTQAHFLMQVLDHLTAAIWDAYADELLEVEQRRRILAMEEEWSVSEEDCEDLEPISPPSKQEPDPDF